MSQFLKWAAEMDRAASAVELASDGSTECLAIIDGNRAIAEVLRHGAVIEAKLAALVTDIEAAMHFVNHTACLPVCGLYCTPPSRCTCGVNDIRNALAAAKVQPTDLDQLTR